MVGNNLRFTILMILLVIIATIASKAEDNVTLTPCEIAIIEATKIGWVYAETGVGFKAMIIADNTTKKICGKR